MAKPNFSFQKRQREQERARKKQEKLARRQERANAPEGSDPDVPFGVMDGPPDLDAPGEPSPESPPGTPAP